MQGEPLQLKKIQGNTKHTTLYTTFYVRICQGTLGLFLRVLPIAL